MFVFACFSPHPPLILPNVGSPTDRLKVKKTIKSLESLAPKLKRANPDLIIISSPHPDWGFDVPAYFLLAQMKNGEWRMENYLSADLIGNWKLEIRNSTVLPILTTLDSPQQHYEWGKKMALKIPKERRLAWIASGDMSHRLKEDGPYGFHPSGPKFDQEFIKLFKNKDVQGILNLPERLIEEAGECGLRSFCLLLGALKAAKVKWQPEVLSYEGPFGVGYLVAQLI